MDSVVRTLEAESSKRLRPEVDDDAIALVRVYGLPADAWTVWSRRACAAGFSLSDYVLHELAVLARRTTIDDVILEFREAQTAHPSMMVDMDAVIDSTRYARAQ